MFSVVCPSVCLSVLGCGVPLQGYVPSPLSVQGRGPAQCAEPWLWSPVSRYRALPSPDMQKLVHPCTVTPPSRTCSTWTQTCSYLMILSSLYRDPPPTPLPQICSNLFHLDLTVQGPPFPYMFKLIHGITHTVDKRAVGI